MSLINLREKEETTEKSSFPVVQLRDRPLIVREGQNHTQVHLYGTVLLPDTVLFAVLQKVAE
jgi:hypothetical protein